MTRKAIVNTFDEVLCDVIDHQGSVVRDMTVQHGITPDHMDQFMAYETKLFVGMAEVQQQVNDEENAQLEDDICCD